MLSLCMIVKNEIKFIEQCIINASSYVDEIIIVDSGSTDGTLEVLNKYNCKIYNFNWCNDYSKARNYSITKSNNDWVLILDADEHISTFNIEHVKDFIKNANSSDIGEITLTSFVGTLDNIKTERIPRLFNKNNYIYERAIHERLKPLNKELNINIVPLPIEVDHFGYLNETIHSKEKNVNYINILKKSISEKYDPYLQKHLISCYYNEKMYTKAINEINTFLLDTKAESYEYFSDVICTNLKIILATQNYDDAKHIEKYFDICKNNDEYLFNLSLILSFLNRNEEALDILLHLVNKDNITINKNHCIYNIAYIFFINNLFSDAKSWFEKLPSSDDIKAFIEFCNKQT